MKLYLIKNTATMRVLFGLFIVLFSTYFSAQVMVEIDVKTADFATGKKLSGVNIEVVEGTSTIQSATTTSSGNLKFTVPSGKKYKLELTKSGKVSRYLIVDTKGIAAELLQGGNKAKMEVEVSLFDKIPDVDFSFVENNPITEFYFDGMNALLTYDQDMANKMKKKIDSILADANKKNSQNDVLYQKAIDLADGWYKEAKYEMALTKYEEASMLKPKEQYPKDKIKELDALVKKQKQANLADQQKEEQYKAILSTADELQKQKKYNEAINKYNEALKIKDDPYPKDQINNVNKLIEKTKKEQELENQFKQLVSSADALFNQKKYPEAKEKYMEAVKLKPSDENVKKRISEIESLMKTLAEQEQKNQKYQGFIKQGDEFLAQKKYPEAKAAYNQAIAIDNIPNYPKDKLKEIEIKILEDAKNAEKIAKFNSVMKLADELMSANKLNEAKTKYLEASNIDPNNVLPKQNIAKIDQLLQSQAEAQKKLEQINNLLKDGNTKLGKNDLFGAKKSFEEVLLLDNKHIEAQKKLDEINTKINQQQSQAQLDEKFKLLKNKGIELFKSENYLESKQAFNEAKGIKSNDAEVNKYLVDVENKLKTENEFLSIMQEAQTLEISNLDAAITKYKLALSKKPSSEKAKNKISELEKIKSNQANIAEVDKKYLAVMKKANESFTAKKYIDAIKLYNDALTIKPNEKEPVEKAAEAQKLEESNKSESDKQYQKILEAGQKAIDEKNWTKAKEMYNRALTLKKDDIIPKNKLTEIEELIKKEKEDKLNQADKDKKYNDLIKSAETFATNKDYEKAINSFVEAGKLKPNETLPPKRITELTDLKNKNSDNSKKEQAYNDFMSKGELAFKNKLYDNAIKEFNNALQIKPGDKKAEDKIKEIQQILDNESKQNDANKLKKDFDAIIKSADELFNLKEYKEAKNKYELALNLISNDKYAKKQYDICLKQIKLIDDENIQYQKIITKADEFFGNTKYDRAKELYERALSLRNTDSYPKQKLAEIEAILNPKVVKKVEPLAILGEPSNEDPEKVHEALIKAELQRKSIKSGKLKNRQEKIQDAETGTTIQKKEQLLTTTNTISNIEKKNTERDDQADENRQNTVDELKNSTKQNEQFVSETSNFKYNEQLNNKDYVNNVSIEKGQYETEKSLVYEGNTKGIVQIVDENKKVDIESNLNAYNKNIKDQGQLESTQIKISEKVEDDFDSRKIVEKHVSSTNNELNKNDYENQTKESKNILNLSVEFEEEKKNQSIKAVEDGKISNNNKEEIEAIESDLLKSEFESGKKSQELSLQADKSLNETTNNQYNLNEEQDKIRQDNVENLKKGVNEITNNEGSKQNEHLEKSLTNQNKLSENQVNQDQRFDIEKNKMDSKVENMTKVNNEQATNLNQNSENNNQQILDSKYTISTIDQGNSLANTEKSKKVDENISEMQTVSTDIQNKNDKNSISKEDQLKSSQGLLDKLNSKQIKFDDKVANELGTLYPEGVSQEVFNQHDENGLLKAVITRRIVVKNGYGQIYIRTQTLTGITFSKNSNPSTEYVWQKETQDAKLTKNY
ncbi:MAG: hypothetical protein HYU67_13405 [Flavobacteriia bacterium]|nr:hypothetical protein [Flavobacteriia bacterium]